MTKVVILPRVRGEIAVPKFTASCESRCDVRGGFGVEVSLSCITGWSWRFKPLGSRSWFLCFCRGFCGYNSVQLCEQRFAKGVLTGRDGPQVQLGETIDENYWRVSVLSLFDDHQCAGLTHRVSVWLCRATMGSASWQCHHSEGDIFFIFVMVCPRCVGDEEPETYRQRYS